MGENFDYLMAIEKFVWSNEFSNFSNVENMPFLQLGILFWLNIILNTSNIEKINVFIHRSTISAIFVTIRRVKIKRSEYHFE